MYRTVYKSSNNGLDKKRVDALADTRLEANGIGSHVNLDLRFICKDSKYAGDTSDEKVPETGKFVDIGKIEF